MERRVLLAGVGERACIVGGWVGEIEVECQEKWKCVPEVEEIVDTLRGGKKDVDLCRAERTRNVTNRLRICEQDDLLGAH